MLLLDEPLSNLDPTLREKTRRELKRAIRQVGITTLFVTHEQEEAFELGDRVAVLNAGGLEQVGTPEELFEQPATRFVATFIGRSSVLPVAGKWGRRIPSGPVWPAIAGAPLARKASDADLVVRPEALDVRGAAPRRRARGRGGRAALRRPLAYFLVVDAGRRRGRGARAAAAAREGDRVLVVPASGGPVPRVFPRPA